MYRSRALTCITACECTVTLHLALISVTSLAGALEHLQSCIQQYLHDYSAAPPL